MNHSRIRKSAAITAAGAAVLVGQLALAGNAFAAGSSDLGTAAPSSLKYWSNTNQAVSPGIPVTFKNFGPDASTATLTVTGTGLTFNGQPTLKGGTGKVTWTSHSVTVALSSLANGASGTVYIPAKLNIGNEQVLDAKISGPNTDPGTSNNSDHAEYGNHVTAPKPSASPSKSATSTPTKTPTTKPTASPSTTASPSQSQSAAPAPSPTSNGGGGGGLAETGANSNTPMLIGGAGALVVIGGGLAFAASRRRRGSAAS